MEQHVALGQRITAARKARGWTRSELARKASLDPSYVTRIETAQFTHPSVDKVQQIAAAFGVPVTALTDPPPEPDPDEDARLRRLIEQRVGDRAGAEFVEALMGRVRGRPDLDYTALLDVIDVLVRSLPPATR